MKHLVFLFLLICTAGVAGADTLTVSRYDDVSGLTDWHVTGIVQDEKGLIWISTWRGLDRYDGYDFVKMSISTKDGVRPLSQHVREMFLGSGNNIWCKMDGDEYFRLDANTYEWSRESHGSWTRAARHASYREMGQELHDRQGNLWRIMKYGIEKISRSRHMASRMEGIGQVAVRAMMSDRHRRLWIATKEDKSIRLYTHDGATLGFLGRDGRTHKRQTSFGASVYCMMQDRTGAVWLGSKPDGLFRLTPTSDETWRVERVDIGVKNIYDIVEDTGRRVWVATQGRGVVCIERGGEDNLKVTSRFRGYPAKCLFARRLLITKGGIIVCATNGGLLAADIKSGRTGDVAFTWHHPSPDNPGSISSPVVTDICEDEQGNIYTATNHGLDLISGGDILRPAASFRHADSTMDDIISMTPNGRELVLVNSNHVTLYNTADGRKTLLDTRFWVGRARFTEARPLPVDNAMWIFGHEQGAFIVGERQWKPKAPFPAIIFSSVSIGDKRPDYTIISRDTLILSPCQRSLTLTFAALDFADNAGISYRYRLDNGPWTETGHNHKLSFFNLSPDTYCLEVSSTDAFGRWTDNSRRLVIVAEPLFRETTLAAVLLVLLLMSAAGTIVYVSLYIRRLHKERKETLDAYLALLSHEKDSHDSSRVVSKAEMPSTVKHKPDEEAFMQRVMAFVEANISNEEATITEMAAFCAASESSLYRKTKTLLGVSPGSLLQEARLQHAARLLVSSDASVTDIAFQCGFTDPKYFSKSFKRRFGLTPSDHRLSAT